MAEPRRLGPVAATDSAAIPAAVTLRGLVLTRGATRVLDDLGLTIPGSGVSAILGPNGAGKSMLLAAIAGLEPVDSGSIDIAPDLAGRVGLVLQKPVLLRRSVRANLTHALWLAGRPRNERRAAADALLAEGQLLALADRPARRLSGGEQVRLCLLRALAHRPALLLLDEPTANLDPRGVRAVEALVTRIARQGVKVVIVSHDVAHLRRLADDVAFIQDGRLVEQGAAGTVLQAPRRRETRAYLDGELLQ